MGKIPSLRAMNNKLRDDANNLGEQVDVLSETIDDLEPEADRYVHFCSASECPRICRAPPLTPID